MRILDIRQNTPEWEEARRGKITGSKSKDVVSLPTKTDQCARYIAEGYSTEEIMDMVGCTKGTVTKAKNHVVKEKRKVEFYQLVADKIAERHDGAPMERGSELEDLALNIHEEKTGKKLLRGLFCLADCNENMAVSPDGLEEDHKRAVEVKCLKSALHLMAYFEQEIPKEYMPQVYQYFNVIETVDELDFVFYDPDIPMLPYHTILVKREDIEKDAYVYKTEQLRLLGEVDSLIKSLV